MQGAALLGLAIFLNHFSSAKKGLAKVFVLRISDSDVLVDIL